MTLTVAIYVTNLALILALVPTLQFRIVLSWKAMLIISLKHGGNKRRHIGQDKNLTQPQVSFPIRTGHRNLAK